VTVITVGKVNDRFLYLQLTIPIRCAERNTLTYQNSFEQFCRFVKVSFWQFTVVALWLDLCNLNTRWTNCIIWN